jgi:molybdopterin-guanine dinucleotide biosynthesis protein A
MRLAGSVEMKLRVTGVILAGGMSTRLGRDKAVEPLAGQPLIGRVLSMLSDVTDTSVVVVNDEDRGAELPLPEDVTVAVDAYPNSGSLGGIFTGLRAASADWALVVACDMPFLNPSLLSRMLELSDGYDVVAPVLDGRPEPTHALYSKACLPHMEERLQQGKLKITGFYEDVRVRYITEDEVDLLDPGRLSFFNVNTQDDLDRAKSLVAEGH